jgi:hypothetical protein
MMVCPICGNDEFYTREKSINSITVTGDGEYIDQGELIESDWPISDLECTSCGETFRGFDDLIDEEDYARESEGKDEEEEEEENFAIKFNIAEYRNIMDGDN